MNTRCKLCVLMWLAACAISTSSADDLASLTTTLPELAAPPQGKAQWIARSMRLNGLPMTLKAFESRLSPDAVLSHYESLLKSASAYEARRMTHVPWQILMLKSHRHLISIHARAANHGSEGTILVSPALEPASLHIQTKFPTPPSAHVASLQQYDDEGLKSEHISLSSARAPFIELKAFSELLIRDGWSVTDTRPAHDARRGFVLEAQRRAEHAQLVIIPDAAQPATTAIVIAWSKR